MNIAVLFDEQAHQPPTTLDAYVRQAVLGPGVLQGSGRLITVRSGTVLLRHFKKPFEVLAEATFFGDIWRLGDADRLRQTYRESEVFAWFISNVDEATARDLDDSLSSEGSYLGMHAVDLTNGAHLVLYRQLMSLKLRVQGSSCWVFYSRMALEGEPHAEVLEQLDRLGYGYSEIVEQLNTLGFAHVELEDIGLRGTIVDEFDSLDHFARLESLRTHLKSSLQGDAADELLLRLEDLHPSLAATLGTSAQNCARATSAEDFAQAGLSCRRYLSQLADELFPAQDEKVGGREVTRSKVKNRLGAYLAEHIDMSGAEGETALVKWGKELDRLNTEACAAVHEKHPTRERVRDMIRDLALLTVALLSMAPENKRRPYAAYARRLIDSLRQSLQG